MTKVKKHCIIYTIDTDPSPTSNSIALCEEKNTCIVEALIENAWFFGKTFVQLCMKKLLGGFTNNISSIGKKFGRSNRVVVLTVYLT